MLIGNSRTKLSLDAQFLMIERKFPVKMTTTKMKNVKGPITSFLGFIFVTQYPWWVHGLVAVWLIWACIQAKGPMEGGTSYYDVLYGAPDISVVL